MGLGRPGKDRIEIPSKAEWLAQNQQIELNKLLAEQDQKHQAEIVQLNEQLEEQGKISGTGAVIRRQQQWEGTFDAVDDLIV
jgi:hypothetical protein